MCLNRLCFLSPRLFEELEQMNRSLENMVQQRTAELEHKTVLLEQAKQEALQAASSKSIFLSNMSHESKFWLAFTGSMKCLS
ncbi:hypothetical protein BKA69DRAFT_107821 [Paraphysoderma sedebokerense]|nr:hypothetical protein BKA69DRAFT_107821 [Paraphysoderma sedebokerense]